MKDQISLLWEYESGVYIPLSGNIKIIRIYSTFEGKNVIEWELIEPFQLTKSKRIVAVYIPHKTEECLKFLTAIGCDKYYKELSIKP